MIHIFQSKFEPKSWIRETYISFRLWDTIFRQSENILHWREKIDNRDSFELRYTYISFHSRNNIFCERKNIIRWMENILRLLEWEHWFDDVELRI